MSRHQSIPNTPPCERCGRCCSFEIPLTLLDIESLARGVGSASGDAFQWFVERGRTGRNGLFKLRKCEGGGCVFLSEESECSIYSHRPWTCSAYSCERDKRNGTVPWVSFCSTTEEQRGLWEQAVAIGVTRAYIEQHGAVWIEDAFNRALASIKEALSVRPGKKLRLAKGSDGSPIALAFDCGSCENRGKEAHETIVSLDDIERLSAHLSISPAEFFARHVGETVSEASGCLQLRRDDSCVFHGDDDRCAVAEVKPLHCKFTPCPKKTRCAENADRYYLGAGTVDEQYRHQVALGVTRAYVSRVGARFEARDFDACVAQIRSLLAEKSGFAEFCERVRPFRYVDDTLHAGSS